MNENNLVTKANTLVMAHYNTSLEELRVVRTLISMIQPQDEDFKPYIFHIAEFINLLGVQDKSKYTEIPKITENLMRRIIKIKDDKRLLQVAWLSSADYKYGEGIVELQFDPKLKPYLLDLKEKFITYKLENILRLSSKYSIRFYEILKCNEFKKSFELKLSNLIETLALGESYKWFDIKRQIIEPAKKELAEKTDITFDYETITQRKKVIALKFTIKLNPKNKPQKLLQESPKQLKEPDSNTQPNDIKAVQTEFQRLYKGELVDKFVKEMLEKKGLTHVQECLRIYKDYIKCQNIRNIGGHFKTFVMEGYAKPVQHNDNKKPQRDNFEQREYSKEELEKYYYDFSDVDYEKERKDEPKNYTYIED